MDSTAILNLRWWLPKLFLQIRALLCVQTQVQLPVLQLHVSCTPQTLHVQNGTQFFSLNLLLSWVNNTTILPMTQTRKQGEVLFLNLSCPIHQQEMSVPSLAYISTLTSSLNLCCNHPNLIPSITCLDCYIALCLVCFFSCIPPSHSPKHMAFAYAVPTLRMLFHPLLTVSSFLDFSLNITASKSPPWSLYIK